MKSLFTFTIIFLLILTSFNIAEAGFFEDSDFDGSDLANLAAEFNNCSSECSADFDGDGDVDLLDLRFFSNNIGSTDVEPIEICGDYIDNDLDGMVDEDCVVPYSRTIVVDGNPDDWEGISPIVIDGAADSDCDVGTDVKSIYIAQDDTYLYWRVDTYSGNYSFGETGNEIELDVFISQSGYNNGQSLNGILFQIDSLNSCSVAACYNNNDWINLYNGSDYGTIGTIAEGKIFLSEINPFKVDLVTAYFAREDNPPCDWVNKEGVFLIRQVLEEICGDDIDNDLDGIVDENCIVPNLKTIIIDGNAEDWVGIDPIHVDDENDSNCESGTDVKSIYLSQDENYLYWRVDTYSGSYSFGDSIDPRQLILLFYEPEAINGPYPNGITVGLTSPHSGNVLARYTNNDWTFLYDGAEYGTVGTVAEGRIPLAEFAAFRIEYVSAYFWRNTEPQCDWASVSGELAFHNFSLISSDFDNTDENWSVFATNISDGVSDFQWFPDGGMPGGYIIAKDNNPSGTDSSWFFVSNDNFIGDWSIFDGGCISFDLFITSDYTSATYFDGPDVILDMPGSGVYIEHRGLTPQIHGWNHYEVSVDDTKFSVVGSTLNLREALLNVSGLLIRGDYFTGWEWTKVDNVNVSSTTCQNPGNSVTVDGSPYVTSSYPEDGATNVSVNLPFVSITYNEPMVGDYSWTGGPFHNPPSNYSDFVAPSKYIHPNGENKILDYNTTYTVYTLEGSFHDLAGNSGIPYTFSFTTESEPISPPSIVSTTPPDGATNVPVDLDEVSIAFNKPMSGSVDHWGDGSGAFYGWENAWSDDYTIYYFRRGQTGELLPAGTTITEYFGSGFTDQEGYPLTPYSFSFTTENTSNVISIPTRKISIDGNSDDWSGIVPVITDPEGDGSSIVGSDLKAIYIAKDSANVYIRIDLWDGTPSSSQYLYYGVSFFPEDPIGGCLGKKFAFVDMHNFQSSADEYMDDVTCYHDVLAIGNLAVNSNMLELSVPLDALDPPLHSYVTVWNDDGSVGGNIETTYSVIVEF